jgi:hypothetical protein
MDGANLVALRQAFDNLVRAGDDSLRAAYNFGQIADALNDIGYSWAEMGDAVDRRGPTIYMYVRLYRRYPTLDALTMTAKKWGTYDINRLTGSDVSLQSRFGYQCLGCGSWDTHRVPMSGGAEAERAAARAAREAIAAEREAARAEAEAAVP